MKFFDGGAGEQIEAWWSRAVKILFFWNLFKCTTLLLRDGRISINLCKILIYMDDLHRVKWISREKFDCKHFLDRISSAELIAGGFQIKFSQLRSALNFENGVEKRQKI